MSKKTEKMEISCCPMTARQIYSDICGMMCMAWSLHDEDRDGICVTRSSKQKEKISVISQLGALDDTQIEKNYEKN